jgi:hypothetical protein
MPDSAGDHEALHAYALPGMVTYGCNALLPCMSGNSDPPNRRSQVLVAGRDLLDTRVVLFGWSHGGAGDD